MTPKLVLGYFFLKLKSWNGFMLFSESSLPPSNADNLDAGGKKIKLITCTYFATNGQTLFNILVKIKISLYTATNYLGLG